MRRALASTALAVAILGAAWVAAAAWSGRAVTARLELRTQELQKLSPHFEIVAQTVEHGLFRSTHQVTVRLGCVPLAAFDAVVSSGGADSLALPPAGTKAEAGTPIELSVRSVVQHGPLPGLRSVGVASIDSELLRPQAYRAQLEKLFGKQPIVRVHSEVGFGGDLVSDFTIAGMHSVHPEQGSFDSKPVQGRIEARLADEPSDVSTMRLDVSALEVSARGSDGSNVLLKVGRMQSETRVLPRADPKLWLAPIASSGTITSVDLSGGASSGAPALPMLRAHWDGIKFSSESKLANGLWSTHSDFSAKGKVNDVALDKVELRSSIKRIHAATYQHLLGELFDTLLSCEQPAGPESFATLLLEMEKDLGELLVHNPEYALDRLSFVLSGKRAELSYSAGIRDVSADDAATPITLLLATKSFLRANLRVHTALVEEIAQKIIGDDKLSRAAGVGPQTRALVDGTIDSFAALGYLTREGEDVVAKASVEGGQLLLNGKPLALTDLLPSGP